MGDVISLNLTFSRIPFNPSRLRPREPPSTSQAGSLTASLGLGVQLDDQGARQAHPMRNPMRTPNAYPSSYALKRATPCTLRRGLRLFRTNEHFEEDVGYECASAFSRHGEQDSCLCA